MFAEDEVAFLVTIGAQLAATLSYAALGSAISPHEPGPPGPIGLIQGLPGAPGVTIGNIVLPSPLAELDAVANRAPDDIAQEEANFRRAVRETQEELRASGRPHGGPAVRRDARDIRRLHPDPRPGRPGRGRGRRIRGGNWAPAALRDTIGEHARMFEQAEDPYLRARAEDIRGIGRRILLRLMSDVSAAREYPDEAVLLGDEVSLARVADVPPGQLRGIVCLRGSVVSHTAVLARGLGIPAVMGLGPRDVRSLDGHPIIVDGYRGRVFIDPLPAVIQEYRRLVRHEGRLSARLAELRDVEATTTDDVRVGLGLNVGLLTDIDVAANLGVDEVGLYRSEFPFMSRQTFPMEHEQYEIYRKVLKAFAPKPVTMRTLDIGGDKPLSYFPTAEENPFLGWRGIRLTLDRPDIFLPQLRAMLRANIGLNNLRIMFPMIGQIDELKAAREAVDRARRELDEEGCPCPAPAVGAMVEVPSALLSIPRPFALCGFLLHRHQRPHPVPAGGGPEQSERGALVQPAGPRGHPRSVRRDPRRAALRQAGERLRRDGRRSRVGDPSPRHGSGDVQHERVRGSEDQVDDPKLLEPAREAGPPPGHAAWSAPIPCAVCWTRSWPGPDWANSS